MSGPKISIMGDLYYRGIDDASDRYHLQKMVENAEAKHADTREAVAAFFRLPDVVDLENQLYELDKKYNSGHHVSVSLDCWVGLAARNIRGETPQTFTGWDFDYQRKLMQRIVDQGIRSNHPKKVELIISAHQLGGNVGDDGYLPIPRAFWAAAAKTASLQYQEQYIRRHCGEDVVVPSTEESRLSMITEDLITYLNTAAGAPGPDLVDPRKAMLEAYSKKHYSSFSLYDQNLTCDQMLERSRVRRYVDGRFKISEDMLKWHLGDGRLNDQTLSIYSTRYVAQLYERFEREMLDMLEQNTATGGRPLAGFVDTIALGGGPCGEFRSIGYSDGPGWPRGVTSWSGPLAKEAFLKWLRHRADYNPQYTSIQSRRIAPGERLTRLTASANVEQVVDREWQGSKPQGIQEAPAPYGISHDVYVQLLQDKGRFIRDVTAFQRDALIEHTNRRLEVFSRMITRRQAFDRTHVSIKFPNIRCYVKHPLQRRAAEILAGLMGSDDADRDKKMHGDDVEAGYRNLLAAVERKAHSLGFGQSDKRPALIVSNTGLEFPHDDENYGSEAHLVYDFFSVFPAGPSNMPRRVVERGELGDRPAIAPGLENALSGALFDRAAMVRLGERARAYGIHHWTILRVSDFVSTKRVEGSGAQAHVTWAIHQNLAENMVRAWDACGRNIDRLLQAVPDLEHAVALHLTGNEGLDRSLVEQWGKALDQQRGRSGINDYPVNNLNAAVEAARS